MKPLYMELASLVAAIANCKKSGNAEWLERHSDKVRALVKEHMPSGGGFDCGTTFDFDKSTPERLVFHTGFHHMTEGMYDGWTNHAVTVRPSLSSNFVLSVSGKNRNMIKDYIAETFDIDLHKEVE